MHTGEQVAVTALLCIGSVGATLLAASHLGMTGKQGAPGIPAPTLDTVSTGMCVGWTSGSAGGTDVSLVGQVSAQSVTAGVAGCPAGTTFVSVYPQVDRRPSTTGTTTVVDQH